MSKQENTTISTPELVAPVPPEYIVQLVSRVSGVPITHLTARPRGTDHIAVARHIGMYLLRKYTTLTLGDIAAVFGRTNHGTALHAVERISHQRQYDERVGAILSLAETSILRSYS